MTQVASPPLPETLADLLEALGDIPPERVWLRPPPGTATEQDVVDVHDRTNRLCELVDGVLVEKAMGFYESRLAVVLIHLIERYLESHKLGIVTAADGMVRLAAGLVRMPDVSFVSWERLPGGRLPREPIPDLAPDLAVEVLSRSNTPREMARKLREYFAAGVRLVWMLDPPSRSMQVYTAPDEQHRVEFDGIVDGGDVLPGFTLPLREVFDRAGPAPKGE